MSPRISVLVVNYNSGAHLARCLSHLARQTMGEFEAIVVDNGSSDSSLSTARAAVASDERFRFDEAGGNLGFAAGNNRAARLAQAQWLATLNPDAFAEPDWLENLLDATHRYPDAAMFGSTQISATDPTRLDGCGDAYLACGIPWRSGYGHSADTAPDDYETFGPCAAAAMYRADTFRALGGFEESFFCYCEDSDLAFRMRLRGQRCIQLRDAVVAHVGGGSGGVDGTFAIYHGTRNMIWTFARNVPLRLLVLLLPVFAGALVVIGVKSAARGTLGVRVRATCDSIRALRLVWRARATIQSEALVNTPRIARALCWRPCAYFRRAPHIIGPARVD